MDKKQEVRGRDAGSESARDFLRRETQALHQAVEDAFARFDLLSRDGLTGFLIAQHRAVNTVEEELERRGVGAFIPCWSERRRGDALAADLTRLGAVPPESKPIEAAPNLDSIGRQFGALYVLEGSRLGGRVLARQVLRSSDPDVRQATTFLLHHVSGGEPWRSFVACLEALHAPREHLLEGARWGFSVFRRAAIGSVDGLSL